MARIRIPAAILAFVLVREFDYTLPEELIAQEPLPDRAQSRMLVLHRSELRWEDRSFQDLPQYLTTGDCLILNKSKVLPSRLFGVRDSGTARIEVFLIEPVSEDERTWRALVRPGRKVHVGEFIRFGEALQAQITERGEHGERTLQFEGGVDLYEALDELGHVPLPPYIRRSDRPADRERYNTVFAQDRGSVAAPTAGLHFTSEALEACAAAGAAIATVTLHVGLGTFAPVHVERIDEISLHSERYNVASGELEKMQRAKRRIAVGTTTVRTVETVYSTGRLNGATNLFIHPGYELKAVDAMLTNFHLPKSSLLMLVSAFAGREFVLAAYDHAVRERYRFFSYGDCMLIL